MIFGSKTDFPQNGSILDDISRLSNALYAMDTTDIQRYPDNYEILSTDAALRAERIACRLRHLIYSSTLHPEGASISNPPAWRRASR